jgi:hypothetical protein
MSQRSRVIGFGSALLLVIAGVAGGVAFGGTFGQVLTLVLVSLGGVLATALVFYEVGLSEDHERARDEAEKRARREPREEERRRLSRPGVRLERRRGQRRRLDR